MVALYTQIIYGYLFMFLPLYFRVTFEAFDIHQSIVGYLFLFLLLFDICFVRLFCSPILFSYFVLYFALLLSYGCIRHHIVEYKQKWSEDSSSLFASCFCGQGAAVAFAAICKRFLKYGLSGFLAILHPTQTGE